MSLPFRISTILLCFSPAIAAMEPVGKTMIAKGNVQAYEEVTNSRKLRRRAPVFGVDTVETSDKSKAQFRMNDGTLLALKENSKLLIAEYQYNAEEGGGSAVLELVEGGLRSVTGAIKENNGSYKLKTPVGSIGIRGTHYEIEIIGGELFIAVWDGAVDVSVDVGTGDAVSLGEGENFAFAKIDEQGEVTELLEPPENFNKGHSSDPEAEEGQEDSSNAEGDGQGEGDGQAEGNGQGEGDGQAEGNGQGEGDGQTEGDGQAEGNGQAEDQGQGEGESQTEGDDQSQGDGQSQGDDQSQGDGQSQGEGNGQGGDGSSSGGGGNDSGSNSNTSGSDGNTNTGGSGTSDGSSGTDANNSGTAPDTSGTGGTTPDTSGTGGTTPDTSNTETGTPAVDTSIGSSGSGIGGALDTVSTTSQQTTPTTTPTETTTSSNPTSIEEDTSAQEAIIEETVENTAPTAAEEIAARTGIFTYNNIVDSSISTTDGGASNLTVTMEVNFDEGDIDNGEFSLQDNGGEWYAVFQGQINQTALDLTVNFASHGNNPAEGNIGGFFSNAGNRVNGNFNFTDNVTSANANGSFAVE